MEIKEYCIYSLDFAYTRISSVNNVEIDFRGVLSYHTKDLDLFAQVTQGNLDLDAVNIFLYFQIQRHIDLILKDINEDEIVNQRPIIVNRIKMIVRKELDEIGLEFVNFKQISLWSHGATARGIAV
ncbi:MAG: hypothetical protein ACXABU_08295 [Candidatus Hodarchaeales archaeon]|jgi:hypothetical protein